MAVSSLATFTDANFDAEVLRSSQPVLVEFWATWCPSCRALAPVVAELARQYSGHVKMGTLNIDDCPSAPTRFDVRSIPTLLLFKDGRVIGQVVGAVAKPKIDGLVRKGL